MAKVEPILDDDLDAVAEFLHQHMNSRISPEIWKQTFEHTWCPEKPNSGFLIRDDDRIVGVHGALYSEQFVRGIPHRFCNLTSWCVLKPYRNYSFILAQRLLDQEGWNFTNFSATDAAARVYRRLEFSTLKK